MQSDNKWCNGVLTKITPLCCAIEFNRFEIVKILVEHGADVMKESTTWRVFDYLLVDETPLETAMRYGFKEIVDYLQRCKH